jgi:hypothetical protein
MLDDERKPRMKSILLAGAVLAGFATSAQAQLTVVSPFHNGMGFSCNADGSHDTYVFRNGALFDRHYEGPQLPASPPSAVEPLLPDSQ